MSSLVGNLKSDGIARKNWKSPGLLCVKSVDPLTLLILMLTPKSVVFCCRSLVSCKVQRAILGSP